MSYELRRVAPSPEHLTKLAGFFHSDVPGAGYVTSAYLRWLYADNPAGAVVAMDAWAGDALAGHFALVPVRARVEGTPRRGALCLHVAVGAAHRGRRLFTQLAEETCALARELGLDHVVGVANANSTPGFIRNLGFQHVCPLDASLLWLSPHVSEDPEDASWERDWTPEDLRWRVANPAGCYSVERRRGVRSILASTGIRGVRALLHVAREGDDGLPPDCALPPAGRGGLRLRLGRGRRVAPRALGGVPIPVRLRPSPLNLIFRSLAEPGRQLDPRRVELQAIDFDAY